MLTRKDSSVSIMHSYLLSTNQNVGNENDNEYENNENELLYMKLVFSSNSWRGQW